MKKIISLLLTLILFLTIPAYAKKKAPAGCRFDSVIKNSGVDVHSISISIKTEDGKEIYGLNDKILMNPASIQKVLTAPITIETLGDDYKFETNLYSRGDGNYIIQLGADPFFTAKDLRDLINCLSKETTKKIYIDDSILDKQVWGEGWQWDDDLNKLMPKFSSYNIDRNLVRLVVSPNEIGAKPSILNSQKAKLVFLNNVVSDKQTNISVSRDNTISPNTISLNGTVARPTVLFIPINNLKDYYIDQLTQAMEKHKIYLKASYGFDKVSADDKLINSESHSISQASDEILKNSNNMVSETLFKLAGKKYCKLQTGTTASGIKMFNDYCKRNNLDISKIRITDASGVSKNNLISSDFMTSYLALNKDNKILMELPHPGEGTLTLRMLPIRDSLRAKTGTLSNVSSIAGYLTARSGKKYVFCIMDNDMTLTEADKKMLEDYLIKEAYLKL